ncbi:MAG: GlgB N-terminal domain-containing protein [Bifidobacterium pseudocatenulatum]
MSLLFLFPGHTGCSKQRYVLQSSRGARRHLGSGKHADVVTIRVLRPLAKSVTIITEQGQTLAIHEYNGVFMALVPAAAAERLRRARLPYSHEYEDGSVVVSDDPIVICRPSARWTCIYSAKAVTSACGRHLAHMCSATTTRWVPPKV